MSIRPPYAEAILDGVKTVELRRRRPAFTEGSTVLVYVTAPHKHVAGAFDVAGIHAATPAVLWADVGDRGGVDRATFDAYFAGCETAYAIEVANPRRLGPVPLEMRPPQSYLMLRDGDERHHRLLALTSERRGLPDVRRWPLEMMRALLDGLSAAASRLEAAAAALH